MFKPKFGKFPCGKCVECKEQYSTEWAFRCMLEASKHEQNCFITLTYNDANLPKEGVCKRSAQLFMKRLRKSIEPLKVRYFLCGEYGAKKIVLIIILYFSVMIFLTSGFLLMIATVCRFIGRLV